MSEASSSKSSYKQYSSFFELIGLNSFPDIYVENIRTKWNELNIYEKSSNYNNVTNNNGNARD